MGSERHETHLRPAVMLFGLAASSHHLYQFLSSWPASKLRCRTSLVLRSARSSAWYRALVCKFVTLDHLHSHASEFNSMRPSSCLPILF